jgi:hypothetical protein
MYTESLTHSYKALCNARAHVFSILLKSFLLLSILPLALQGVTLTFEGIPNGSEVKDYYASNGVTFIGTVAIIDSDDGGTGDFGGEPSIVTAAYALSGVSFNAPAGLIEGLSFYYSNPYGTTNVRVYGELDLRGNWSVDVLLPVTLSGGSPDPTGQYSPFESVTVPFPGVARSIAIVTRGPNGLFVDDLTVTTAVPEPGPAGVCFASTIMIIVMLLKRGAEKKAELKRVRLSPIGMHKHLIQQTASLQ